MALAIPMALAGCANDSIFPSLGGGGQNANVKLMLSFSLMMIVLFMLLISAVVLNRRRVRQVRDRKMQDRLIEWNYMGEN